MFINKFGNNTPSYQIETKKTYKALRWNKLDNAYDADNMSIINLKNPETLKSAVNKSYVNHRITPLIIQNTKNINNLRKIENDLNTNFVTKETFNNLKEDLKKDVSDINTTIQSQMKIYFINSTKLFDDKFTEWTNSQNKFKNEIIKKINSISDQTIECQRQIDENIESEILRNNDIFQQFEKLNKSKELMKKQIEYNEKICKELSEQCVRMNTVQNLMHEVHTQINNLQLLMDKKTE